jgi:catechol 2,3-dioxygenase-like lactoylglutathione lyase family enzyme
MEPASSLPPSLTGIHHLGITVSDIERSEAWYGKVLGLKRAFVEAHHDSPVGGYTVVLTNDDGSMDIGLDHHPENDGTPFDARRIGLDHLCLGVGNRPALDAWAAHLDALGISHSGIYAIEGHPMAVVNFKDEDGVALELISIN